MQVSTRMTNHMEREYTSGIMDLGMKDSSGEARRKAMVIYHQTLDIRIKGQQ